MIQFLFSLFAVSIFCLTETKGQTTSVNYVTCPPNWQLIGDHCYIKPNVEPSSWEDANLRCHSYGGYILVLESDEEFYAIKSVMSLNNVWMGCTDRYNESTWLCYGENFSNTLGWAEGEPDDITKSQSCLYLKNDYPLLRDESCSKPKFLICEGSPEQLHESQYGFDCPYGWMRLGSRCYFQGGNLFSWEKSQMFCESFGGNLFTIDTEEELMTVSDAFTPEDYWIGCRDHNSSMQYLCFWEDMTSLAEWAIDEPDISGCVAVDSQFQMVTKPCKDIRDFLCEVGLNKLNIGIIGNCPPRWVQANRMCYFYSYDKMTWNDADEYCKDAASQLLFSKTEAKIYVVRNLFPVNDLWIGCKKHIGSNDLQCQGNRTAFLGFAEYDETSGTGEEHCIVMGNAGQLRVLDCSFAERNFVCQMPKDQYLGCHVDSSRRALAGGYFNLKTDNNLKNCTTACNALNYEFVGLQFRRQCFCGNEQYSRYGRRSEWQCGSLCQGQENQYCGGSYRSTVYKAPIRSRSTLVTRTYGLEHSKRLAIFVYSSLTTPSLIACAEACTSSNLCVSFNFCESGQLVANSTKNCELNTGTKYYAEEEQFVLDELCVFGQVVL